MGEVVSLMEWVRAIRSLGVKETLRRAESAIVRGPADLDRGAQISQVAQVARAKPEAERPERGPEPPPLAVPSPSVRGPAALPPLREARRLEQRIDRLDDALQELSRERQTGRRGLVPNRLVTEQIERLFHGLGRVDARLDALEGSIRRLDAMIDAGGRSSRASAAPPLRTRIPPVAGPGPRHASEPPIAFEEGSADGADTFVVSPCFSGSLAEMSLATVLGICELERRTGVLTIESSSGRRVNVELFTGMAGATRLDGQTVSPVLALREALTWREGRFWFLQGTSDPTIEPRAVGSIILEATRQNDEALRAG